MNNTLTINSDSIDVTRSEYTRLPNCVNDLLFQGDCIEDWEMTQQERAMVFRMLEKIRPKISIEVGTFKGGCLSVMAKYSEKVYCLEFNPDYVNKLKKDPRLGNVEFILGDCATTLPTLVGKLNKEGAQVDFALIDATHRAWDVQRDIDNLLRLVPKGPMHVIMHDSFMPSCRQGMLSAHWESCPCVQTVMIDFIPGVFNEGANTMTCGLGLAVLGPTKRTGQLEVLQDCATAFRILKEHSVDRKLSLTTRVRNKLGRIKRKLWGNPNKPESNAQWLKRNDDEAW